MVKTLPTPNKKAIIINNKNLKYSTTKKNT